MAARSTISTHVLDTASGQPASGVAVRLLRLTGDRAEHVGDGVTNTDGRIADLAPSGLVAGEYRLTFDVGTYRRASCGAGAGAASEAFFERITLDLNIVDTARSYHVPLLLAPFGCTTYRGS